MTKNSFELPWWYRQVPRDFMSSPDVSLMTAEEIGSFFLLLQNAWLAGEACTLPNDPARLAKLARVERVSELVISKFSLDRDGRLFNQRLLDEWKDAVKRSKDGKKAISARWEKNTRPNNDRDTTVLPSKFEGDTTNTNTNTNTNKSQNREKHASSESASGEAGVPAPTGPARQIAAKLASVLGRENLKPTTLDAWAAQAERIITEHGEQVALDVIQFALVDSADGFWRGRVFAMKNFVRSFATMREQMNRKTAGTRATDPLAQRAASLSTGHDFTALAKGDL